jgi:NADH:ubiquinone oxidoreductase subunit H
MTEHSAVIFVFFFLAEYASIILMCILLSIVFLGGYDPFYITILSEELSKILNLDSNPLIQGLLYSSMLALKSCALIFAFI